jgi:imidazolonepropionase-like amidohydrolase
MTLQPDTAMIVTWPRGEMRGRAPREEEPKESDESADRLAPLHSLIRETLAYSASRKAEPTSIQDLRLEAMIPVVEGRLPVMIMANTVKQIQSAIAFGKKYGLKIILFGGADAMHCVDLIREAKIPVVLSSVYRNPPRRDASYDAMYALPGQLKTAGIPFSIASEGRFGASAVRNLPYNAAASIAFGLSPEDALRAITLSPAEIFGVADRLGSLDVGKDGTLIVCNGEILDTSTQVERAWIQGRAVDLSSKHTRLYEKYKTKYDRQP